LKRPFYLVLILAGFLTACVTTEAWLPFNAAPRPKVSWEEVKVYLSADQVPGKYEEVAQLTATRDALVTAEDDALRSLRKRAGGLGANAIILQARRKPTGDEDEAVLGLAVFANRMITALAIFILPKEKRSLMFPG